jgi:hypothetical protein
MKLIEKYKKEIDRLEEEIKLKKEDIENFEIDPDEYRLMFDYYIDEEIYEGKPITIMGIQFLPSTILKELDPTAYDVQLNDFISGVDAQDDKRYIQLNEELDELELELEDYERDLEEIEKE